MSRGPVSAIPPDPVPMKPGHRGPAASRCVRGRAMATFLLACALVPTRAGLAPAQQDVLSARTPVRVEESTRRTVGAFRWAVRDTLLVRAYDSAVTRRIALHDVTGFEVGHERSRHAVGALKGAGWGALVGGLIGGILWGVACDGANLLCNEKWYENAAGGAFFFAVPGALIGAVVGAASGDPEVSWEQIEPGNIRMSDCLRDWWDECTGRHQVLIGGQLRNR